MLKNGEMIGRYRVVRLLGRGGMGCVYLAWDDTLAREAAVKVVGAHENRVENAIARFRLEARAIAGLDNPHVIRIFDFLDLPDMSCIVMEYVDGETLCECIARRRRLPVEMVQDYATQLLEGLACAHGNGIVHRDIKPANILISRAGMLKLTDFGLVKSLHADTSLTETGMAIGTVHYLAPEVARGEVATAASDMYSLGVTLFECLAGGPPIQAESPLKVIARIAGEDVPDISGVRPDLPPAFAAWLMRLLVRDASKRYHDADEALRDLRFIRSAELKVRNDPAIMDRTTAFEMTAADVPLDSSSSVGQAGLLSERDGVEQMAIGSGGIASQAGIDAGAVDSVITRALSLERGKANTLSMDSFIQIAAEVGVTPECAREAYRMHGEAKKRRHRIAWGVCLALAGVVLLAMGYVWLFAAMGAGSLAYLGYAKLRNTRLPDGAWNLKHAMVFGGACVLGICAVCLGAVFFLASRPQTNILIQNARAAGSATGTSMDGRSGSITTITPSGMTSVSDDGIIITRNTDLPVSHKESTRDGAPAGHAKSIQIVASAWMDTGLHVDVPNQPLAIAVGEGAVAGVAYRIGNGATVPVNGVLKYAAAGETGNVFLRCESGTGRIDVCVFGTALPIAVMPFAGIDAASAAATGDAIAARLAQQGVFQVIERIQIDRVMKNLVLENTEFFDPATAGKMGQLLGVTQLVTGSVQQAGGQVRIAIRRISAETGETLNSVLAEGGSYALFSLQDDAALRLANAIIDAEMKHTLRNKP